MEEFAGALEQTGLDIQTKFMMGVYQTISGEDNIQVIYLSPQAIRKKKIRKLSCG